MPSIFTTVVFIFCSVKPQAELVLEDLITNVVLSLMENELNKVCMFKHNVFFFYIFSVLEEPLLHFVGKPCVLEILHLQVCIT